MAPWRLTLTDQTIRQIDILPGKPKPAVVIVWTQPRNAYFFNMQTGASMGERVFDTLGVNDRSGAQWQTLLKNLMSPHDMPLPQVLTSQGMLHTSHDGKFRLLHSGGNLYLSIDNSETRLDTADVETFIAAVLDYEQGTVAGLSSDGQIHLYHPDKSPKVCDVGLQLSDELRPTLLMAQQGGSIVVSDGRQLVTLNRDGQERQRLKLHYRLGALALSPDGNFLVTGDGDVGVMRVYDGHTLTPQRQRFAHDILSESRRVRVKATLPGESAALGPIAIDNKGKLAFGISGALCISNINRMGLLPSFSNS